MSSITVFFILLAICSVLLAIQLFAVARFEKWKKRFTKEMTPNSEIYNGPTGDPWWNEKLPPKVDDFTEPRYVYENLVESTEPSSENGRIVGYRISPTLVIHSHFKNGVTLDLLPSYTHRYGGKLLNEEDFVLLKQQISKISDLRTKIGEKPIDVEWFWASRNGLPVVVNLKTDMFERIFQDGKTYLLLLKR